MFYVVLLHCKLEWILNVILVFFEYIIFFFFSKTNKRTNFIACLFNSSLPWCSGQRDINEYKGWLWNHNLVKNSIDAEMAITRFTCRYFESVHYVPKWIESNQTFPPLVKSANQFFQFSELLLKPGKQFEMINLLNSPLLHKYFCRPWFSMEFGLQLLTVCCHLFCNIVCSLQPHRQLIILTHLARISLPCLQYC